MYSITFTVPKKKFWLSLYFNGANSYLFVNGTEIYKFEAKDAQIVASTSKDWSVDNMQKTELNGYVYDVCVDYDAIAVNDILDIHNYLMKQNDNIIKCLSLLKSFFFQRELAFLSTLIIVNSLSCISMNNQECKVRPHIINVNGDDPVLFPFSIKTSKYSGSCNNINNSCANLCVSDVVKNLNVKVFTLMSRTNKTRHIEQRATCKCKCRLDGSVCDNKQRWNEDKFKCKCKELIDKGVCDKGFIYNPSNCECECW